MKPLHIVVNAGNGCANVVFSRLKEHLPIHFTEMLDAAGWRFSEWGTESYASGKQTGSRLRRYWKLRRTWELPGMGISTAASSLSENGKFIEGYYMVGLLAHTS